VAREGTRHFWRNLFVSLVAKGSAPTILLEAAAEELRGLVRLRERLPEDLGDRLRQLHRAVDLKFPEFTNHVRTLESELAIAICRVIRPQACIEAFLRRGSPDSAMTVGTKSVNNSLVLS